MCDERQLWIDRRDVDDAGRWPDVSANGDGLYSCDFGSDTGYTTKTGTSMATPSVTGAIALLPNLSPYRPPVCIQ